MSAKLVLPKPICEDDLFAQYTLDGGIMIGRECLITKTTEGIELYKLDRDGQCELPDRLCQI